jgi:hypothetical protein
LKQLNPFFCNCWATDHVIKVGDVCGDCSYVGDLAVKKCWRYNTWVREEGERYFVSKCLWTGAILFASSMALLQQIHCQ